MNHPRPIDFVEHSDGNRPALRGARCEICHEVLFPATQDCPLCLGTDSMRPFALAGHGVIRRFTIAERGPTGFDVPYVQAWVKLDDGPVVFGCIATPEPAGFTATTGDAVNIAIAPIGTADNAELGWCFALEKAP